ncbi:uncharacterized protein LOC144327809 [Podarcis muralis]
MVEPLFTLGRKAPALGAGNTPCASSRNPCLRFLLGLLSTSIATVWHSWVTTFLEGAPFALLFQVRACLVFYITCTIVVAVINVFYLEDILFSPCYGNLRCSRTEEYCEMGHQVAECCTVTHSNLLVLTSLGLFICISMAAFGCKVVCRR